MIIFIHRVDYSKIFNSKGSYDEFTATAPYWSKYVVTDLEYDHEKKELTVWQEEPEIDRSRFPLGSKLNFALDISIYSYANKEHNLFDTVTAVHYNGKTKYMLTDVDVYDCYNELSTMLHDERVEEVLSKV